MKKQIKRLSPHQNAKVFGIMMAVLSLIFVLPMSAWMAMTMPSVDVHGNPMHFPLFMFLALPLIYLVFGYVWVAIGSVIYNIFVKFIGGIEFELED
ncbi:MAG: hypothetical protein P8Y64_11625, partial [Gammaproteobacteria bacterium]